MADAVAPSPRSILFVCTGNTCRSPLAEAICKRLLADSLHCSITELPDHGWEVASSGVAAWPGDSASPLTIEVAKIWHVDLTNHRSQMISPELLTRATAVVTMTSSHMNQLTLMYPDIGPRPMLLCGPMADLEDPIGGDLSLYRHCATTIESHLRRHIAEWLAS